MHSVISPDEKGVSDESNHQTFSAGDVELDTTMNRIRVIYIFGTYEA